MQAAGAAAGGFGLGQRVPEWPGGPPRALAAGLFLVAKGGSRANRNHPPGCLLIFAFVGGWQLLCSNQQERKVNGVFSCLEKVVAGRLGLAPNG